MSHPDPFHDGERAVQTRAGETHTAILNARMIAPAIVPGALPFIARQPWVILGAEDPEGRLWCSARVGGEGFAEASPDGTEVRLDLGRAPAHPADPLRSALAPGRPAGALFIEPATRRRLRVNGRVAEAPPDRLRLAVEESFPNCPKFIRPRAFDGFQPPAPIPPQLRLGLGLGVPELARLAAADTLFIATLHPERGVDVSHRGGDPGFAVAVDGRTLRLPDRIGNGLFQSFGNLAVDPRMAMLVPDFRTGGLLHLTGTARVLWDDPASDTGRVLEFAVDRWVSAPPAPGRRWSFSEI